MNSDAIEALRDRAVYGAETSQQRKKKGRPSLYTKARASRFLDAVGIGHSVTTAAMLIGVGRATIFTWLDRGKALLEILQANPEYVPESPDEWDYLDFLYRYWEAQGDYTGNLIESVSNGILTNPELALRVLALKVPEEWGGRQQVDMTVKGDPETPVQHKHTVIHEVKEDQVDFITKLLTAAQEAGLLDDPASPPDP